MKYGKILFYRSYYYVFFTFSMPGLLQMTFMYYTHIFTSHSFLKLAFTFLKENTLLRGSRDF